MPRTAIPKGRLLIIGGHEQRQAAPGAGPAPDKSADFILAHCVEELPGQRAVVVEVPAAPEVPGAAAQAYLTAFARRGVHITTGVVVLLDGRACAGNTI